MARCQTYQQAGPTRHRAAQHERQGEIEGVTDDRQGEKERRHYGKENWTGGTNCDTLEKEH